MRVTKGIITWRVKVIHLTYLLIINVKIKQKVISAKNALNKITINNKESMNSLNWRIKEAHAH